MIDNITIGNVVNSLVPISRFNKGEANKIFEEVKETGFKIVLKNNTPACILLTPEVYDELMETVENYRLLVEAEKRIEKAKSEDFVSADEVMNELGIKSADLDNDDVEIG
ncbi:antitoxin Phd_YefM of type II toxin-antitoxin system [Anaerobacterium chartisolvens]|uniref:Antitoxin Phd_YefM of type II toxin-antitoxin system n=1 Tax=Anaerobacterium chartisolvens TaxID=1297424 RepID=A0A369BHN8_9FIRM|nr:type II toxin-antitoxin system Phd/YefM family antitoxin [Anaerobacterium chartisolvens]RCX19977.1 antitoxin Phd_YefM of type II toxin-antitoxin system [Anaerobacterium chartisolvens]